MNKRILFLIIIICHSGSLPLVSQISCGGTPLSFREHLKSAEEIPLINLPGVDNDELIREDVQNSLAYQCESRIALGIRVDISPGKSGLWEKLPEGGKLWRTRILSKGAKAIHILFDQYTLPEGADLFLYNKDRSQVLGAFGWENNQSSGMLAVAPVTIGETR